MRIATIDIGTNTILMLIADISPTGMITVISDDQAIARLGKGVDKTGAIGWDAFTRCESILKQYTTKARELRVDVLRTTGTSALRDAHNREDFTDYMQQRLELEIEILDGDEEALWSYGGAISGFSVRDKQFAVLDIGGGSTELTIGAGFHITARRSLDIGCVRLTEKHLHSSPPSDAEMESVLQHIDSVIDDYPNFDAATTNLVGVGGTATTLAAVELGLRDYDGARVAGYKLTRDAIESRFDEFRGMSKEQLQNTLRIDPGRADIILIGITILHRFLCKRRIDSMVVSERGLRYGIAMREWERSLESSTIS